MDLAENSGPPSLVSSIGTPNVEKSVRSDEISPLAPDSEVPGRIRDCSVQPDSRSAAMK